MAAEQTNYFLFLIGMAGPTKSHVLQEIALLNYTYFLGVGANSRIIVSATSNKSASLPKLATN